MASLALAICICTPLHAQVTSGTAAGNEQVLNLVLQMQQLQDEIRMLRGQLEEQAYELQALKDRQRDQYLDLDQRLSALGTGGAAVGPAPAVASGTGANTSPAAGTDPSPAQAPAEDVPELAAPKTTPSDTTAIGVPATQTATAAAPTGQEQADYDQAFTALKELRYADAAEQFKSFIAQYPDSSLAGNAHYWLGESYYVTRNYDIALGAFQDLLDKYPESAKAGDGLLKIGFTHYELRQWDQARAALEQVQERYPDTTLARLAEGRLRSMKLEGHL